MSVHRSARVVVLASVAIVATLTSIACSDESGQQSDAAASSSSLAPVDSPSTTDETDATDGTTPSTSATSASGDGSTFDPTTVPVVPSAGCGSARLPAGETTEPFAAAGLTGTYVRHVPPSAEAGVALQPMPVVFDLHGYSEPAFAQTLISEFGPLGDQHGFVTLTPQVDRPVPLWYTALDATDATFLAALLDEVQATLCTDLNRVFVAGLSHGAFMASTVACVLADRVAAVATVAGLQAPDGCTPTRPVPVIAFHGTADGFVAWEGGLGPQAADLPSPDGEGTLGTSGGDVDQGGAGVASVLARTSTWAGRNGCQAEPASSPIGDDVTMLNWECPADATVTLYQIANGGHTWPGSPLLAQFADSIGPTTFTISATELIWAFFAAHPLAA
jgi:polyhydroxybutyrate depolymerase